MIEIDGERLLADLRALAAIGGRGKGVDRPALSPADIAARRWLAAEMEAIGLHTRMDRHGTVLGMAPGVRRSVLVGSHSDTVPEGGWLDGALGVVYGLAIARAFRVRGDLPAGVDAVSFQDEEGTWLPCLGARSFVGTLAPDQIAAARNASGAWLTDALAAANLSGEPIVAPAGRYLGFLEAHIEQGPRLLAEGRRIGVVTGFAGIRRMTLRTTGRPDHAGTTPMRLRRDAARPLFRLAAWAAEGLAAAGGPHSVWNIGGVKLFPGAPNVVPAAGEMLLELRDTDPAVLDALEAAAVGTARRMAAEDGIGLEIEVSTRLPPIGTDPRLRAAMADAAADRGEAALMMPSGAGHDSMILATHMPAALLFVPSIGGRSHTPEEDTDPADIVLGAQVLARAVERTILQAA
jgi:N-carbamoyl-L-amino-acid hydrolase